MTSTITLPDTIEQRPASSLPWMRHSLTLAGRSVKKMMRHPEQFFDVTLQPVLFLLIFVYVLGGAIAGSTHDYLQFVLPGILIQTVLFSTISIGVNLNTDIKEGVFDRFRSLPIARSAPLVGAMIAECLRYSITIGISLIAGFIIGYRTSTDPRGGRRLPARAGVRVVHVLDRDLARDGLPRGRSGAGHRLHGAVPADVRLEHVRLGRHDARLAAGLGQRQPGHAPHGRRARPAHRWTRRRGRVHRSRHRRADPGGVRAAGRQGIPHQGLTRAVM